MTTSVLEKDYVEPDRPFSQKELAATRNSNYRSLRLGKVCAQHVKCGHFYLTKFNGRKEKEIIQTGSGDTGNCSVCWKLNKTPRRLRNNAKELINHHSELFYEPPDYLTYDMIATETDYYKWLYDEFV